MISSTPMRQLVAVVLDGDVDSVTRALLDEGVMHFISIRSIGGAAVQDLQEYRLDGMEQKASGLRKRLQQILESADIAPRYELDITHLEFVDENATEERIAGIENDLKSFDELLANTESELHQLRDMVRQIDLYGDFAAGLPKSTEFSFLQVHSGTVASDAADSFAATLAGLPTVAVTVRNDSKQSTMLLLSLKRDEKRLEVILDQFGWNEVDLSVGHAASLSGAGGNMRMDLQERITAAEKKLDSIAADKKTLVTAQVDELLALWENIRLNELYGKVQGFYSRTAKTVLFTGWVPADSADRLDRRINEVCSDDCYLEWHNPSSTTEPALKEAPVLLKNPGFLKPFELLVKNYAVPAYGTIDPTPLVAVAFLVMFGLMFGDAGHGLVLALSGMVGRMLYKKHNNVRDILTLLTYCGATSIITGILFGSYFGFQLFPPLWFDYHGIVSGHSGGPIVSSIYDVLAITIYFGISVIGLGLVLNWINLTRRKRWFLLIFDKAGVIGGLIYGAGIWATRYFVSSGYKVLPDGRLLALLLGLPVLVLAFKAPIHHYIEGHGKLRPMMVVDFIMEWIVEILEVFSGYLANTLSFMRVAGLGIAHEALLIAFFAIARSAGSGTLVSIPAILILIMGNVLIIGLEGLSAGIQSLRLNYYEFFSKYFTGRGRAYQPVSLRVQR